jgi:bacillithiol biosynthesis cysteine-adding enzyme BshC
METGVFSDLFLKYIQQDPSLNTFINLPPTLRSFNTIIKGKKFDDGKRIVLHKVLKQQYVHCKTTQAVELNIERIKKENTFTITTGHQLNLFTGSLYFIYKILTVINTCEILNRQHPDHHFIPLYWMASEDHDLEEIRSFSLFGKKYSWDTDQEGPVGRMNPSSIRTVLDLLPEKVEIFENAYLHQDTLADAVRYFVNALFAEYGLVVIDADDVQLKMQFRDIIKDDLVDHHSNDLVESASSRLAELGYKTQVYPRAINLFYMENNLRKRLIKEGGYYKIIDTDLKFTEKEILMDVDTNPQNYSPNVILRPLYQEMILPNIAYIGGPAEIAYWLQLKDMFDHFKVSFPILLPRNFALIISKGLNKKLRKLMVRVEDIFKPVNELKNKYIEDHTEYTISLDSEEKIMDELFESIRNKSRSVDQSLEGFVQAEKAKVLKIFENIGKRFKRSEEQKQSVELKQLENLKEKLFPGGNLQERSDNFLNFALNNSDFIENIKKILDPFDFRFNIIIED